MADMHILEILGVRNNTPNKARKIVANFIDLFWGNNQAILESFHKENICTDGYNLLLECFLLMCRNGFHIHRSDREITEPNNGRIRLLSNSWLEGYSDGSRNFGNTREIDKCLFGNSAYVFSVFGNKYGDPSYGRYRYNIIGQPVFFTIGDWIDMIPKANCASIGSLTQEVMDVIEFSIVKNTDWLRYLPVRMVIEVLVSCRSMDYEKIYNESFFKVDSDRQWEVFRKLTGKNIQSHFYNSAEAVLISDNKVLR
uniref:Uncharacterized protein n=1 Tax=Candidatus Kentrum sp. LPFa TaxID=2126335 RepID=A0A450WTT3_9GAMM|nr:MAG: hypothetical protein BECKLPF1236B_GA0070989_121211 [Candidatus Kentron sp. LPFa]